MKKNLLIPSIIAAVAMVLTSALYLGSEGTYKARQQKESSGSEPYAMEWAWKDLRTGELNPFARLEVQNLMQNNATRAGELGLEFESRGPDNVGGRTRAVIELIGKPETLIAGGVTGGIWMSYDGGGTWQPHEQFLNLDSSSSIISCIHQDVESKNIYVGTGSSFDAFSNSALVKWPGFGMYVSTDEGETFQHITSTTPTNRFSRGGAWIAINRIRTNEAGHIYAATESGLFMSEDGGDTWINPVYIDPGKTIPNTNRCADVSIGTDDKVLVSYYGGSVFLSETGTDKSFEQINNRGLISGGTRTVVMIAPSNPDVMYVMFIDGEACLNAIYKSSNGGTTFNRILVPHDDFTPMAGGSSCQGVYDACLGVSATDENTLFIGGVELWRYDGNLTRVASEGGSPPFQDVLPNYVHADKHYFYNSPNDPSKLYVTTDGGISYTVDRGNTWNGINKGYITTQFYGIAHFSEGSGVFGGTQDNGTLIVLGNNMSDPYVGFSVWGNDGIDCDASQVMPISFASSQSGMVVRADLSTAESMGEPPVSIVSQMNSSGNFYTVVKLWENPNDKTSKDSIAFEVLGTEIALATGNGLTRTFNESFTPVQPAAKVIQESLVVESSGMILTPDPNDPTQLIGDGEGTVTYNEDRSIDVDVTFEEAPSENANILVLYEEQYKANDVLYLESENMRSLQGSLMFEYRLETDLNPGDVIKVQDPAQSLLFSTGDDFDQNNGLNVYRNVLNAQELLPDPISIPGVGGNVTCVEVTDDGNTAFIGNEGGTVYRVSGFQNVYSQEDANTNLTVTPIITNASGGVTGIAIDHTDNNRLVVTLGGYGGTDRVRYSSNALGGSPTFINVHGNLAPMPIYDAEFNVNDPKMVLLGTDFGLWATGDITAGSVTWSDENNALSYVPTYDIRQQWLEFGRTTNPGMVYVGTHGRGLWQSSSILGAPSFDEGPKGTEFISDFKVFPNPMQFEGTFSFESGFNGNVNIAIYDINGRQIRSWKERVAVGQNRFDLTSGDLRSGSYFAVIESETGGKRQTAKFLVMK